MVVPAFFSIGYSLVVSGRLAQARSARASKDETDDDWSIHPSQPSIDDNRIAEARSALTAWGLRPDAVALEELGSERDQNFRVSVDGDPRFVPQRQRRLPRPREHEQRAGDEDQDRSAVAPYRRGTDVGDGGKGDAAHVRRESVRFARSWTHAMKKA